MFRSLDEKRWGAGVKSKEKVIDSRDIRDSDWKFRRRQGLHGVQQCKSNF